MRISVKTRISVTPHLILPLSLGAARLSLLVSMGKGVNLKSGLWRYYSLTASKDAMCKECSNGTIIPRRNGCTTQMRDHLRKYHPGQFADTVSCKDKYKDRSIICSEILCDNPSLPASFFRSESFLKLFPQAEHGTFPTRGQLMGTIIPTQVQELKADLKQRLSGQQVTIITDSWSSRNGSVCLTAVLGYFVNANFEREGVVMRVAPTYGRHTAENIRDLLNEVLADYDVQPVAVVSDAASNIRKAVRLMGTGNILCCAHQMHLNVRYGLNKWSGGDIIKRLKKFTHSLHLSQSIRSNYFSFCDQLSLRKRTIPQSIDTRWSSEFNMICIGLEQIDAVNKTLLTQVKILLEPYAMYTEAVCKEDSPLGDTLMVWEALRNHLKQTIENQQGDIVRLAQLMLDDLTAKRWKNSFDNSSFLSAVFFDPTVIRYFTSSDPEAVTIDWQAISDEIRTSLAPPSSIGTSVAPSSAFSSSSRRARLFPGLAKQIASTNNSPNSAVDDEIRAYLAAALKVDNGEEALVWWKQNQSQFPILSKEARKRLGTPPTSVSAERLFSQAGILYRSHLKSRLKADNAEAQLMLRMSRLPSYRSLSSNKDPIIVPIDIEPLAGEVHKAESDESARESEVED